MHGNAVVPNGSSNINTVIKIFVLFALVQFELVRFYDSTHCLSPTYLSYECNSHEYYTIFNCSTQVKRGLYPHS